MLALDGRDIECIAKLLINQNVVKETNHVAMLTNEKQMSGHETIDSGVHLILSRRHGQYGSCATDSELTDS